MPTEIQGNGKIYMKDIEEKMMEIGSVHSIESIEVELKDENFNTEEESNSGEISITLKKDEIRCLMKKMQLENIKRKRFKKLLMGYGMQRNEAEIVAQEFNKNGVKYTPFAVKEIIKMINEDAKVKGKEE